MGLWMCGLFLSLYLYCPLPPTLNELVQKVQNSNE